MRKQFLLFALIVTSWAESYSQITFENGYFIDESNNRIECFIKNIDWRNNPTEFEYMLTPNDTVQKATIQTVKEFGIKNASRYIRARTNVDRSYDRLDKLSTDRNPDFKEELIFLKVLIEGQASLFLYIDGNLTRFFYKFDDSEINQLVYKRFLIANKVSENNHYKQQLSILKFNCDDITFNDISRVRYSRRDLTRLFVKYNECIGSGYTNYKAKQKKDLLKLTIRPGLNYSSLDIKSDNPDIIVTDFAKKIRVRMGIEAEYIMPFNKNKWSIIFEPTYQYFKSDKLTDASIASGNILISKVNYESIEFPIGLRHYFYLNDNSKIFANASYVFDYVYNSYIISSWHEYYSSLELLPRRNIALGVGYKFKDRYGFEMRYGASRNIIGNHLYWNSDYRTISIVMGYSFF